MREPTASRPAPSPTEPASFDASDTLLRRILDPGPGRKGPWYNRSFQGLLTPLFGIQMMDLPARRWS